MYMRQCTRMHVRVHDLTRVQNDHGRDHECVRARFAFHGAGYFIHVIVVNTVVVDQTVYVILPSFIITLAIIAVAFSAVLEFVLFLAVAIAIRRYYDACLAVDVGHIDASRLYTGHGHGAHAFVQDDRDDAVGDVDSANHL